jgi:hypothetical protein
MTVPKYLYFHGHLFLAKIAQALDAMLDGAFAAQLPGVTGWRAGGGPLQRGARELAAAAGKASSLDLRLGLDTLAYIEQSQAAAEAVDPWCDVRLHLPVGDDYVAAVRQGQSLAEHLMFHGALATGSLERGGGGGGSCVPEPPIARRNLLVVAHHADIENAYSDLQTFHRAWDDGVEANGCCLLIRAVEAARGPDFLAAIQEDQWALARAARPGLTKYPDPWVADEEAAVYRRSPAYLQEVAYLTSAGVVEYTSVAAPGQHLAGWEVDRLAALVRSGRMGDGRPIHEVRVVFLDKDAAETEKGPLLDQGIRVLTLGENGQPQALEQ